MQALATCSRDGRAPASRCWSARSRRNIGHLEAAAGVAGLIKVVLALQHGEIPRAPAPATSPTRTFAWEQLAVRVMPTRLHAVAGRRAPPLAGVSSFGFSGTNAHVVLEEAPARSPVDRAGAPGRVHRQVLALSAQERAALRELRRARDRDLLDAATAAPLATSRHRERRPVRHFDAAAGRAPAPLAAEAAPGSSAAADRGAGPGARAAPRQPEGRVPLHRPGLAVCGMGARLYETEPAFARPSIAATELFAARRGRRC